MYDERGNLIPTKTFTKLIQEWNLTDAEGKVLPVNEATVGLLTMEDMNFLMQETTALNTEEKKP